MKLGPGAIYCSVLDELKKLPSPPHGNANWVDGYNMSHRREHCDFGKSPHIPGI